MKLQGIQTSVIKSVVLSVRVFILECYFTTDTTTTKQRKNDYYKQQQKSQKLQDPFKKKKKSKEKITITIAMWALQYLEIAINFWSNTLIYKANAKKITLDRETEH